MTSLERVLPKTFETADPRMKIRVLPMDLQSSGPFQIPEIPGRRGLVLETLRGPKEKISTALGQARLLHELANIEMQAMELCLRTYLEYPDSPPEFRKELAELALDEARHLGLCLDGLQTFDIQFGHWPIHLHLWKTVSPDDSLLDRIVIVHRYLEASGLDAGNQIIDKLRSCQAVSIQKIMTTIHTDEIKHVDFGSRWYREICKTEGLDPEIDFPERIEKLKVRLPKRVEKFDIKSRKMAGFLDAEIELLQNLRDQFVRDLEAPRVSSSKTVI